MSVCTVFLEPSEFFTSSTDLSTGVFLNFFAEKSVTRFHFKKLCYWKHVSDGENRKGDHHDTKQALDQNYPVSKPTKQQVRKRAAKQFREDYLRIRPESAEEFNAKRTQKTYGWYTVARLHQTTRWSELLKNWTCLYPAVAAGQTARRS